MVPTIVLKFQNFIYASRNEPPTPIAAATARRYSTRLVSEGAVNKRGPRCVSM